MAAPLTKKVFTDVPQGTNPGTAERATAAWLNNLQDAVEEGQQYAKTTAGRPLYAADLVTNYVANGMLATIPAPASLTAPTPAGRAYLGGLGIEKVAEPRTYTASTDTYVDLLASGAFGYSEVANGAVAPVLAAGALRLFRVVAGATGITGITGITDLRVTEPTVRGAVGSAAADLRYQRLTGKNQAGGYLGLSDPANLTDPARLGSGTRDGTKFLRDDASWQPAAGGGGFTPPWVAQTNGAKFAAMGDGSPIAALQRMNVGAVAGPTATQLGTSFGRVVKFKLPKNLALSTVWIHSSAVASNFRFAIYDWAWGDRMWQSGAFSSVAGGWTAFSVAAGVNLLTDRSYFWCVAATAAEAVAAYRSPPAPLLNQFGNNVINPPFYETDFGIAEFFQLNVTAGVFPAFIPTYSAPGYADGTTGSVPFGFLGGVAS